LNALNNAGILAALQSDYAAARRHGEECLTFARQLGDKRMMLALYPLYEAAFQQGDYAMALSLEEESFALCREMGVAANTRTLGRLVLEMGDAERARRLLEEGLAALRQLAAEQGEGYVVSLFIALTHLYLGNVDYYQQDYVRARSRMEQSLSLLRRFAAPHDLADALLPLGRTLLHLGEAEQARTHCAEGLGLCWQIGKRVGIAEGLDSLALVASWQGEPVRAARLLGAGERLRQELSCPVRQSLRGEHERMKEEVHQALGKEAFVSAWEEGGSMTLEQAVAYALEETPQGTGNRAER
jgi:tetratricopeptide (TPR) repeat protein